MKYAVDKDNIDIQEIFYGEKYAIFFYEGNQLMDIYSKEYSGTNRKGLKYMSLVDKFSVSPWFSYCKLNRKRVTIINRIRSNHVLTKEHLFRKNLTDSDLCECQNIQTINHLVWDCPKYVAYRPALIEFLESNDIVRGADIVEILYNEGMKIILRIVFFILICKIIV